MTPVAIVLLASSAIFWTAIFRHYRSTSVELNQYAEPPLRSSSLRAAIVAGCGFGLSACFALICIQPNTPFLKILGNYDVVSFSAVVIIALAILSPIFNCLSVLIYSGSGTFLPIASLPVPAVLITICILPYIYVLYKTRKEIELRFQMSLGNVPKELPNKFALSVRHGNPVLCGILGAAGGVLFFPLYAYFELFKAKQSALIYQKTTRPSRAIGNRPYNVTKEKITFDIGEQLAASDQAMMKNSETPICPKCKRPLTYLENQEKWWCLGCKRAVGGTDSRKQDRPSGE